MQMCQRYLVVASAEEKEGNRQRGREGGREPASVRVWAGAAGSVGEAEPSHACPLPPEYLRGQQLLA